MESTHSFTFKYDPASDDAMVQLWRLTCNNSCTIDDIPGQGTRRINNRTWRLLNKKIILKQTTNLQTQDLQASFIDKISHRSMVSNSSTLSLGSEKKSTQTSSIISNEEKKDSKVAFHLESQENHEEDEGYHEDESEFEDKEKSKQISPIKNNIFYIGNSPSPSTNKEPTPVQSHLLKITGTTDTTNEVTRHSTMQRQGSLFSNFGFSSQDNNNDSKDVQQEDDFGDGYSSTDISEDEEDIEESEESEESEDSEEDEEEEEEHTKSVVSQIVKEDNESEWLSVSSESNNSDDLYNHPPPPLNFHKVDPVPIAVQGKRISTPILHKPRSLLSGLFLNEMARINSVPSNHEKPHLQRSRTTGIFTIENKHEPNSKKPAIVFTNKFPSMTDLTTSEEGTPAPMVKQETIVAISDVNAISTTDRQEEDHEKLSTSLNKISRSLSHQSFRSILSRSQLNLTKMYSKSKPKPNSQVKQVKQPSPELSLSPPLPMIPPRPVTTTTIELKPNEKLLDESLSASLKEALSIDYKLGKVPLPERVIDDRAITTGVDGTNGASFENDFDDYHSKGW